MNGNTLTNICGTQLEGGGGEAYSTECTSDRGERLRSASPHPQHRERRASYPKANGEFSDRDASRGQWDYGQKSLLKISELKIWLLENMDKIDRRLARLTKKERRNKLPLSRMKQDITVGPRRAHRIKFFLLSKRIKECYKEPHIHEFVIKSRLLHQKNISYCNSPNMR